MVKDKAEVVEGVEGGGVGGLPHCFHYLVGGRVLPPEWELWFPALDMVVAECCFCGVRAEVVRGKRLDERHGEHVAVYEYEERWGGAKMGDPCDARRVKR